jgi:polyisoprenoid-binding protein YceI
MSFRAHRSRGNSSPGSFGGVTTMDGPPPEPAVEPDEPSRSSTRIVVFVVVGVVAVIGLFWGAILIYTNVINDSPSKLDTGDLSVALGSTPASTAGFDGDWAPTSDSQFGYRVDEVLAGVNTTAVGRSNEISGKMTIEGTSVPVVDVEVKVASITSDQPRRDNQFTGRIMSVDQFPTASFKLTQPIELGSIPAEGEEVKATATGNLTLRGVTKPVTFDVTAKVSGGKIGVLGSIPVLFSDYGIDNPSFGAIKTKDNGLIEFVLVFDRA